MKLGEIPDEGVTVIEGWLYKWKARMERDYEAKGKKYWCYITIYFTLFGRRYEAVGKGRSFGVAERYAKRRVIKELS